MTEEQRLFGDGRESLGPVPIFRIQGGTTVRPVLQLSSELCEGAELPPF